MEKIGNIELRFTKGPTSNGHPLYPGFKQETRILPKGSIHKEGALALPCDILLERDVAVKMRDGVTIYIDVYRPANAKFTVPAIIAAGPFGKNGGLNRASFDSAPWRHGVPQETVSGLEKFEGPDPAYWCHHGYAVVHPDMRGTWMSEGDTYINCSLDGKDGYDLVEWIAEKAWSNKCVSMAGNSYLAQTQWFVGAENPPHLTCLAPWEGWNDMYNDSAMRGGITNPEFQQAMVSICGPGLGRSEDITAMAKEYPLWNEYWEDRKAKLENIHVPMYIVASWTNALHTQGTFRGFIESSSTEKWLRVHNSHEWPDFYYPQNVEDLRKFFDHYMKGTSNGWLYTPHVRLSILNAGHHDIVNRPEAAFPLARQVTQKLYLNAEDSSMSWSSPVSSPSNMKFAAKSGSVEFSYTFLQRTELTGYFALKLWVEVIGQDDVDLFCKFSKYAADGSLLEVTNIDVGYLNDDPVAAKEKLKSMHDAGDKSVDVFFAEGSTGRLRVSHRALDTSRSTSHQPVYTHAESQKLTAGEIVPVEISMWPFGMVWEQEEKIVLSIAGYNLRPEVAPRTPTVKTLNNDGAEVVIHTGGERDSHLVVPWIPEPNGEELELRSK